MTSTKGDRHWRLFSLEKNKQSYAQLQFFKQLLITNLFLEFSLRNDRRSLDEETIHV